MTTTRGKMGRVTAFFSCLGVLLALPANAGGMTSSGGEYLSQTHNPWYLHRKGQEGLIRYCVLPPGSDFSLGEARVSSVVEAAFTAWEQLFSRFKLRDLKLPWLDGPEFVVSSKFKKVDCVVEHELRVVPGSRPAEVEEALSRLSPYTVAFAGRLEISDSTLRANGGMIWLAPDRGLQKYSGPSFPDFWSDEARLFNVLVHEVGHIFGLPHLEDGVMNASFPAIAVATKENTRIDIAGYADGFEIGGSSSSSLTSVIGISGGAPQPIYTSRPPQVEEPRRNEEFCQSVNIDQEGKVRMLTGSSLVIDWSLCFSTQSSGVSSIRLVSDQGYETHSFLFNKNYDSNYRVRPLFRISGAYYRPNSSVGEWSGPSAFEHDFVTIFQAQSSGILTRGNQKIPVVFDPHGPSTQLFFVHKGRIEVIRSLRNIRQSILP